MNYEPLGKIGHNDVATAAFCVLQNSSLSCNQNVNDVHFIHEPWQLAPIIQFFKQTQDIHWIHGHWTQHPKHPAKAPPNLPAIRPVIVNTSHETPPVTRLSIECLVFGNCWPYWALTFLKSITSWSFIFSSAEIKTVLGCWLLSSNANWDIRSDRDDWTLELDSLNLLNICIKYFQFAVYIKYFWYALIKDTARTVFFTR